MTSIRQQDKPTFENRRRRPKYQSGKMIVRVREDALRPALAEAAARATRTARMQLPEVVSSPFQYLRANAGLTDVAPVFSTDKRALRRIRGPATRQNAGVVSSVADASANAISGISVLSLDDEKISAKLLRTLRSSDVFEYIERVPNRWLSATADPMQNRQWGLRATKWFQADKPSARRINVAVLDSGVDSGHPDLDRTIDHYETFSFRRTDIIGHGTHVAGIIAAATNNGQGISGVAKCRLKAWKVFPDEPDEYGDFPLDMDRYLQALEQVVAARCKVVNLSLGGPGDSLTEKLVLDRLKSKGIVVVAAMGNEYERGNQTEYPAAYDSTIGVGSLAQNLRRSRFSSTGGHIDVTAPGSDILSTLPRRKSDHRDEEDYASWSGTSMATPHVAGLVAMLMVRKRDLTPDDILDVLRTTAVKVPGMRGRQFSKSYGYGLVDMAAALKDVKGRIDW